MLRAFDKWLLPYLLQSRPTSPGEPAGEAEPPRVLFCVCDHFEPLHNADKTRALERLAHWRQAWPGLSSEFTDSDGLPLKHTFFYPIEQYDPDLLEPIADICRASSAETEIHLHHYDDTPETLREALRIGTRNLANHGLLSRDPRDESPVYGFIHGDWAISNSHPSGKHCGVSEELQVLRETGCYADFTMPSAPSPTQARIVNSLYYAERRHKPRSHDRGVLVRRGQTSYLRDNANWLLMIQGPLALNWQRRKFGLIPRVENADLTGANPPTPQRLQVWLRQNIIVQDHPNWFFLKLHTHGAIGRNRHMFLGEVYRNFHQHLHQLRENGEIHLHYVTAREMVNILHAMEDGQDGEPGDFRDYLYPAPQGLLSSS